MRRFALFAAISLTTACAAIGPGNMALPADLASGGERFAFEGWNGASQSRYAVGGYSGWFRSDLRSETFLGTFSRTSGRGRFDIAGPGISSTIEADCAVRDRALVIESAEFRPEPMAYRCDLTADGQAIPARFEVQEERSAGLAAATRYLRLGEIALAGEIVQFRSVHAIEGTSLPTIEPVGYVFEQGGRTIGALQLDGRPEVILPAATALDQRRAIMVAAVALATYRDPSID